MTSNRPDAPLHEEDVEDEVDIDLVDEIAELWQFVHGVDRAQVKLYENLGKMTILVEHACNPLIPPEKRANALSHLKKLGHALMHTAEVLLEESEASDEDEDTDGE